MGTSWFDFKKLVIAALILRIVLLVYGEWQDANLTVKYTDVDYLVFTDAARHVTEGRSPFERATYRYTPLLAILLTPNIFLFRSFGKCLFVIADLVVGYLIHRILVLRGMSSVKALWLDALWLLNPMVANISTRGNAESLLGVMVLSTLYWIMTRRFYPGCAMFGLAVHFKIYPIIYVVPLLFMLDERYGNPVDWPKVVWSYEQARSHFLHLCEVDNTQAGIIDIKKSKTDTNDAICTDLNRLKTRWRSALCQCILFFSPARIMFGLVSGGTFLALTWSMYQLYGDEFLQHTYFYHVTRQDHRHNFSIWFYQMYLGLETAVAGKLLGLAAFAPQLILVTAAGMAFAKDIFFACFIQTFIFVTFNKVCTSQYFMWYLCLLPLVLPSTNIPLKPRGLLLIAAWVAGQGIWLHHAYQLEFLGQNTFFELWIAGVVFFIINCWIVVELATKHQYEYIYGTSGRIRWVWGKGDPGPRQDT